MALEYKTNQINAEVWRAGPGAAKVNQIAVEVWRSITTASATGRRRQQTSINS